VFALFVRGFDFCPPGNLSFPNVFLSDNQDVMDENENDSRHLDGVDKWLTKPVIAAAELLGAVDEFLLAGDRPGLIFPD
jgi:hypothetical protein